MSDSEMRSWLLAIDTSTEAAGVALTDGSSVAAHAWRAGRDQTVSVLAQIDRLLQRQGISVSQLVGVAVATGPGMFNGLRVGMSIAKGLHLGASVPLFGVPTLEITVHPFRARPETVVAIVSAGRDRLIWATYPGEGIPVNGSIADLADAVSVIPGAKIIVGEIRDDQAEVLAEISGAMIAPTGARSRSPAALAEIGWQRHCTGAPDDPVTLAPVYLHQAAPPRR